MDDKGPSLVDRFEFELELREAAAAAMAKTQANRHRAAVDALAGLPRIEDFPAPRELPFDAAQLTVGDLLREGAQGKVHVATYRGRPSVIKLVKRPSGNLSKEARVNRHMLDAAGPHPNVARFRGAGDAMIDGALQYVLVFDRIEGNKNGTAMKERLRLALSSDAVTAEQRDLVVKFIAWKVKHAVAHCNSTGIAHCDVKLHNILFAASNCEPILFDFGCAQLRTGTPSSEWPLAMRGPAYPFANHYPHDAKLLAALVRDLYDGVPSEEAAGLAQLSDAIDGAPPPGLHYFSGPPPDSVAARRLIRAVLDNPQLSPPSSDESVNLFEQ
jgi:serine/threonine protein kinase